MEAFSAPILSTYAPNTSTRTYAGVCPTEARWYCVENRCYAAQGWDRSVREFCIANGLIYQGSSLLTANRAALAHPELIQIARHHGRTVSQVVFRFALEVGMVPLTGTTDAHHMREDLEVFAFRLEPEEVERIERLELA